jgi:hypothetical protein
MEYSVEKIVFLESHLAKPNKYINQKVFCYAHLRISLFYNFAKGLNRKILDTNVLAELEAEYPQRSLIAHYRQSSLTRFTLKM